MAGFRGLPERERAGFLVLLEWFENFRLRHELESGRESVAAFWRMEVLREGRVREPWQLEQWGGGRRSGGIWTGTRRAPRPEAITAVWHHIHPFLRLTDVG